MSITVELINAEHLKECIQIEKNAGPNPWIETNYVRSFEAGKPVLALKFNQKIIAVCCLQVVIDEATILNFVVSKKYQGQGIGQRLMTEVIDFCKNQKCQNVFLEVRSGNKAAISLYEKSGFCEFNTRRNYYPSVKQDQPPEDALEMVLPLF